MPLTPSHAAAAWLVRRVAPRIPLAAVVSGTMAPDYEYLLRLAPRGRTWHSPLGLATLAVPAAVVAWLLWRQVVRPAVRDRFLPPGLRHELAPQPLTTSELVAGIIGAALGAVSHVLWDGMTHGNGWFVQHWPSLYRHETFGGVVTIPRYQILQHLSTVVGGAVCLLWFGAWWRTRPAASRTFAPGQLGYALRTLAALTVVSGVSAVVNATRAPAGRVLTLGYAAVGAMTSFAVAALLWALVSRTERDPS